MRFLRSSRRRRILVAACLPYLLLSVFVDFVHLHPLLSGDIPQISASVHVGACTTERTKTHESPCAICQWLRAGSGLQASVATGAAIIPLPDRIALLATTPRAGPIAHAIDTRGPPFPRFA